MTSEEIKNAADQKRAQAKKQLSAMLKIPEEVSSGMVEAIVDDIISAAILEITSIQLHARENLCSTLSGLKSAVR